MSLEELDLDSDEALDEAVDKVIDDFDSSGDNELNVDEFTGGICKYLGEAKRRVPKLGAYTSKFIHEFHSILLLSKCRCCTIESSKFVSIACGSALAKYRTTPTLRYAESRIKVYF